MSEAESSCSHFAKWHSSRKGRSTGSNSASMDPSNTKEARAVPGKEGCVDIIVVEMRKRSIAIGLLRTLFIII